MEQSYSQVDLRYVERAICMEEFYIHNPGKLKFYIPTLTPFESGGKPKESPVKSSKSHLLNKNIEAQLNIEWFQQGIFYCCLVRTYHPTYHLKFLYSHQYIWLLSSLIC